MDNLPSFQNAKETYKHWCEERLKVIEELKTFRDEVQRQCRILSIGSITYSSVGIVGGGLTIAGILAAPFTFGASLALSAAGVATGVTSGVAGVTHTAVKSHLVKNQFAMAKKSLENHQTTCDALKDSLMILKEDLEKIIKTFEGRGLDTSQMNEQVLEDLKVSFGGSAMKIIKLAILRQIAVNAKELDKIFKLFKALEKIFPSALKGLGSGASKVASKFLSVVVAIGVVVDLGTLILNAVDLAKIEKGQLSTEATKLQKVIDEMDTREDVLDEFFQ